MVAHGYTDLVTPYFGSQLLLNQLPDFGPDHRAMLKVYAGGHMFYSRDVSRRAFRDDVQRLYRGRPESQGQRGRPDGTRSEGELPE